MKYALIGCGMIAPNHIRAAVDTGLEIAALCDLVEENLEKTLALIPEEKRGALMPWTGKKVILGIRPESFLLQDQLAEDNSLTVSVDIRELLGAEYNVYMNIGETKLIMRVPATEQIPEKDTIRIPVNLGKMHFFDPFTEQAICH